MCKHYLVNVDKFSFSSQMPRRYNFLGFSCGSSEKTVHMCAHTYTNWQSYFGSLSLLGNLFTECWAHLRENLIETGANLMMAQSSSALGPASPPVRFHLVALTHNTLLLHFMPHGSMQCCPLLHATLIVNPTLDMRCFHSILILFSLFMSPFSSSYPPSLLLTRCFPCLSPSYLCPGWILLPPPKREK